MSQLILMISGVALILIGVVLVIVQMSLEFKHPNQKHPGRSVDVTGPFKTKATLNTTYPGLVMIFLGTLLEIAGYLATAPWK